MVISELFISAPDIDKRVISWNSDGAPVGDNIIILRSFSSDSDFSQIDAIPDSNNSYEDIIRPYDPLSTYYYKISYQGVEIGPVYVSASKDRISNEVSRLINRALKRDFGTECKLYSKMRSGEHCNECWDDVLGRSIDPNCPVCLGTGYVQGYYDPIDIYVVFPKEDKSIIIDGELSEIQKDDPPNMAWTGNYPIIKPGDLLLREFDKTLWRIKYVHQTAKRMYLLRQILAIEQVDRHEKEYDLI